MELAPNGEFGAGDLALVHFLEFFYRWSDSPERSLAAMLDRMDEAKAALDAYLQIEPHHTIGDIRKIPSSVPEDFEHFVVGMRKAGLPE